jgi:hypothetical protein
VTITLSGEWPNSCIPDDSAISVSGNNIYFNVIHDVPPWVICFHVITGWEQTQPVGPLPPGTYTLEVYQDEFHGGFIGSTTVIIGPGQ